MLLHGTIEKLRKLNANASVLIESGALSFDSHYRDFAGYQNVPWVEFM